MSCSIEWRYLCALGAKYRELFQHCHVETPGYNYKEGISSATSQPSSQPSQTTLLDLRKRSAPAQESDESNNKSRWQSLEEVPAGIVQEEDTLHS